MALLINFINGLIICLLRAPLLAPPALEPGLGPGGFGLGLELPDEGLFEGFPVTCSQHSSNLAVQQALLSGQVPYRSVHAKKSHEQSAKSRK